MHFFLLVFVILTSSRAYCYQEIDCFAELAPLFSSLKETDLVVFDINDVLLITEDQCQHANVLSLFCLILLREAEKLKNQNVDAISIYEAQDLMFTEPTYKLVEKSAPLYIDQLQKQGVPVIGLTDIGLFIKEFDYIPWTYNTLRSFGIHLQPSSGVMDTSRLSSSYERGIVFSRGRNKGRVLSDFLQESAFKPSSVIFIDDSPHNVLAMETAMAERGIPCMAFRYKGAHRLYQDHIDQEVLTYQVRHLLQTKQWINDQKAKQILKEDRHGL